MNAEKSKNLHIGYHQISNKETIRANDCTPHSFKRYLIDLSKAGYTFLTCGQAVNLVRNKKSFPQPYAIISFDDGFKEHYTTVFPILKELKIPATFFYIACLLDNVLPPMHGFEILIKHLGAKRVINQILPKILENTSYFDLTNPKIYNVFNRYDKKMHGSKLLRRSKIIFNHFVPHAYKHEQLKQVFNQYFGKDSQKKFATQYFMSADELIKMQKEGMEIASHSLSHPFFNVLSHDEVVKEIIESQKIISDALGVKTVETFAWPFGGIFHDNVIKIAADTYTSAWNFDQNQKIIDDQRFIDLYNIPRLNGFRF